MPVGRGSLSHTKNGSFFLHEPAGTTSCTGPCAPCCQVEMPVLAPRRAVTRAVIVSMYSLIAAGAPVSSSLSVLCCVYGVVCPGVLQGCAGTARFHSAVPAQHLFQGRCRHRWYIALRCGHGSVPTVPCGHRTVFKCGAHTALPCICRTGTALFLCAVRARPFYTVLCRHRTVFKCGAGTTRLRKIPWLQHIFEPSVVLHRQRWLRIALLVLPTYYLAG